jgi:tRNA(fMet)-specific endonuclease VapC
MPNSGKLLLDSSIVIAHFRQDDEVSLKLLDATALYLGAVALGELEYGARKSANPDRKLAQLRAFLPWVTILPVSEQTAEHYGQIQVQLALAGTPIPQNDVWIAALAQEHGLPIVIRDAHFAHVSGLTVLNC